MSEIDPDLRAREAALDVAESILLQAPAGSGKTEVLTQRFLALLGVVDEPEEILAITFTRKAAAEMKRRILAILDGDIDPARPTAPRLRELRQRALARAQLRGWDLLELRSRLRIQTIDSLNHELARSMPLDGHGGAALAVVDDADELHLEAARRALSESEPDTPHALREALDLVLRRLDNQTGRAESLLAGMLERRAQWLPAITQHSAGELARVVERGLEAIAREAIARVSALLDADWKRSMEELLRGAADALLAEGRPAATLPWLDGGTALVADIAQLPAWRALGDVAMTLDHEWRKTLTKNQGFPPSAKPEKQRALELLGAAAQIPGLQAALRDLRELPDPALGPDETRALGALAVVLRRAALCLQEVFATEGRVDHTAVAGFARQGLGGIESPTELALRRAAALKHLLVDEFQDTSVEQLALLERLTIGWEPADGRSLFAVGDPMQSIYQFRSAEVGLFLRARDRGIGELRLTPHRLTRNFRSSAPLIGWCNAAFDVIFPRRDDVRESAVAFLRAEAGREAVAPASSDDGEVHVTVTALADLDAESEATKLAETVESARARDPGCTVAVLVQSSAVAPPIIGALQRRGFAVRGVDLEPLSRQPAVRDIVSLGCALLHPLDRIAWFAVLRAPHVGLSLDDLFVIAERGGPTSSTLEILAENGVLDALSEDARLRLARCVPILRAAVEQRSRGSFVSELRAVWDRLGAPSALREDTETAQVEAWLAALARRESEGVRIDGDLLRELAEKLRVGAESAQAGSVEILTIHKAKGLEWDVVLLPGLHRQLRADARPLLAWIELPRPDRDADLLLASLSIGRASENDRLAAYIATMRRRRQVHERCRLAYVAATRARRELHLFGYAAPDAEGRPRPRPNTMLHTLWPAVADRFAPLTATAEETAPAAEPPAPPARLTDGSGLRWRLPATWQLPVEPPAVPVPRLSGSPEATEEPMPEFVWVGREARAIGTVVHAELERLARERLSSSDGNAGRREAWRQRLRELGVPTAGLDPAADRIAQVLDAIRSDERARWILYAEHRSADCELRLSGLVDGELRDIVIDRTFVDQHGDRWIVDYKTGSHEGGDLETFISQELERYAPQLRLYRRLARGLGPERVRCALYFPLLRRFVELPD